MESLAVSACAGKGQSASNSRPGPPSPTTDPDDAREAAKLRAEQLRSVRRDGRLGATDRLVADVLDSFAFQGKSECWPSLQRIAREIGKSVQTVRLAVRNLAHFGHVEIQVRAYAGGAKRYNGGNLYVLRWRLGLPPAEPDPMTASPRGRESARVLKARGSRLGAGVWNPAAVGAGVCNSIGAGVCNSTPESVEEEAWNERSGSIRDVENGRGENADATPDGGRRKRSAEPSDDGVNAPTPSGRPEHEGGPADASEVFGLLTPSTPPAGRERAARMLQAELGEAARDDFLPAYRGIASEVAKGGPGGLTASAVAYALAEARKPRTRNRGKVFASTIRRCRENGGRPPAPTLAGPSQVKPTPIPPTYRRDPFRNKATVIGGAMKAIEGRAADGLSPEANRAATLANASKTCESHGIVGEARTDYMTWIGEALAHVLDGAPMPNSTAYWRSAIQDIGRVPRRAAV